MPKLALDWGNVLTSRVPKNRHVSMEQGFRGLAEVEAAGLPRDLRNPKRHRGSG